MAPESYGAEKLATERTKIAPGVVEKSSILQHEDEFLHECQLLWVNGARHMVVDCQQIRVHADEPSSQTWKLQSCGTFAHGFA
ncbi:hypothetical protein D3C71_1892630 [compost metagenome]